MQLSEELKTHLFRELEKYQFNGAKQSSYYQAFNPESKILTRSLIIEPVGRDSHEKIANAKKIREYLIDQNGFGLLRRIVSQVEDKFQIKERSNDKIKVNIKRKGAEEFFLLDASAPVGTLVIYGAIINSIFSRYQKLQGAEVPSAEQEERVDEFTFDERILKSVEESATPFQSPAAVLPSIPKPQGIIEDSGLLGLKRRIEEVEAETQAILAECKAIEDNAKEFDILQADLAKKEQAKKEAEEKRKKLKEGYNVKVSPFLLALRSSPIHLGLSAKQDASDKPLEGSSNNLTRSPMQN